MPDVSGVSGASRVGGATRFSRPQPPQALLDAQQAQAAAHSAPTGPNDRDKRWTGRYFFAPGSVDAIKTQYAQIQDAGRAIPVAEPRAPLDPACPCMPCSTSSRTKLSSSSRN